MLHFQHIALQVSAEGLHLVGPLVPQLEPRQADNRIAYREGFAHIGESVVKPRAGTGGLQSAESRPSKAGCHRALRCLLRRLRRCRAVWQHRAVHMVEVHRFKLR